MGNIATILFVFWSIQFLDSSAPASEVQSSRVVMNKQMTVEGKTFLIKVVSRSSRPHSDGQGECGAGEELTLKILKPHSDHPVFSKLIASCLNTLELDDDGTQQSEGEKLEKAIQIKPTGVEVHWSDHTGMIQLDSKKPQFVLLPPKNHK